MGDAIEKKKKALFLLALAQSDVEIHASHLIEECGLEETIHFYNTHHDDIRDHHTAIGRFIKVVSHITISCPAVNRQGPVGFPVLLLPLTSHYYHSELLRRRYLSSRERLVWSNQREVLTKRRNVLWED